MVTLRERTTQYGIIINLPHDHTATSVNTAVTEAFAAMPSHMKRTLTWDQGVEMARHQELTAATGVPVFFANVPARGNEALTRTTTGSSVSISRRTNLAVHSPVHVAYVTGELNDRPGKGSATTPRQSASPPKRRP